MAANPFPILAGFFGRFFGNTISEAAGYGIGGAIEKTIDPVLQETTNKSWATAVATGVSRPLDAGQAALASIKGFDTSLDWPSDAAQTGFDQNHFDALMQMQYEYPGTGELLELWRRGKLTQGQVDAALERQGIPQTYRDAVQELFDNPLDPAVIATAIQRGIMADPGFLPVGPPTGEGNVKAFPVSPLDPLEEAQWSGVNKERLFVETALVGLPLALVEAAQGYFRGILTIDDFKRAVAEGNTRNEWGDAALEVARQIITAHDAAELQLRGYLTRDQRLVYTRMHGMADDQSDLLYDLLGRSISVHQILIGERRGGVYDGPTDQIPPEYLAALERGNLRPEYYNLGYAGRETYPSYFVTRALAQAGVITPERTRSLFEGLGWPLDVADAAATFYAVPTATAADPNTKKAQSKAYTEAQTNYINGAVPASAVTPVFHLLGIDATAQTEILAVWDAVRALARKQLSSADIRKAFQQGDTNAATGVSWTEAEALAALQNEGWSPVEAQDYLNIPA